MKQSSTQSAFLVGICIFGFLLFMIATTIVLSMIPLYLPKKSVTVREISKGNYNLEYGTNQQGLSNLEVDDINSLSSDLMKALNLEGISIRDAKFVPSLSARAAGRKKRETSDDQCASNSEAQGDRFALVIEIKYPPSYISQKAKRDFDVKVEKNIQNAFIILSLKIKFKNAQTLEFKLHFCKFNATKEITVTTVTTIRTTTTTTTTTTTSTSTTASTTRTTTTTTATTATTSRTTTTITTTTTTVSTTSTASVTTSTLSINVFGGGGYQIFSTTAVAPTVGRRRRFLLQPSEQNMKMPIGGCLMIGGNENSKNRIEDLYKQHHFLKNLPFGVETVTSVDAQSIDLTKFLMESKISKTIYNQLIKKDQLNEDPLITIDNLASIESHIRAWERVFELNQPMLIIENNTQINNALLESLFPHLIYTLPSNVSLLYFGSSFNNGIQSNLLPHDEILWKVNGSLRDTYAYIINPQTAATLLDFIYPIQGQIDSMIFNISKSESFDIFLSKYITTNEYNRKSSTQNPSMSSILIPKVFHFIWLNNEPLPERAQQYTELWKIFHPNWDIQIWTEQKVIDQQLSLYNQELFKKSVQNQNYRQASDILRYEILYQYGGVYIDFDFEPLKSIEPLLYDLKAFVAYESQYFICNGIFGAVPGHELTRRLIQNLESNWAAFESGTVNQQTGPHYITKEVKEMQQATNISIKDGFQMFAPHIFFPYAWYEPDPGHPYDPFTFGVHHFRPIPEIMEDVGGK